jgi:sodium-independent sulfate anion transporter 11
MVVPTAPLPSMTKKIFHINSSPQHPKQPNDLDQRAQKHLSRVFLEEEPTVAEWVRDLAPTRQGTSNYMNELFPSATWISRYNLNWLLGDAIAGRCCCSPSDLTLLMF